MKNINRISLALGIAISSTISYSNPLIPDPGENPGTLARVSFYNVNRGAMLSLKDKDGISLYREKIKNSGEFSKGFDLSNLPDAEYYFELDMEDQIKIIPLSVKENIVEFIENQEYEIMKPKVRLKNDLVYISSSSKDRQSMKIDVYFEGQDLAYSEKIDNVQDVNRIYDFSDSKEGNYMIIINSNGRVFSESIHAGSAF